MTASGLRLRTKLTTSFCLSSGSFVVDPESSNLKPSFSSPALKSPVEGLDVGEVFFDCSDILIISYHLEAVSYCDIDAYALIITSCQIQGRNSSQALGGHDGGDN